MGQGIDAVPHEELSELERIAREMGINAHAARNQKWAGGLPYAEHLKRVRDCLNRFMQSRVGPHDLERLRCAAWLHDAVEDAGMQLATIEQECGPYIRALVWAVTDEPGANRAEKHSKTFPKTKNVAYAINLKLADRIVNVEANLQTQNRGGYFEMYRKEHAEFKKQLYTPNTSADDMWAHLDRIMSAEPSKQAVKLADKVMVALPSSTLNENERIDTRDRIAVILHEELGKLTTIS